MQQPTFPFHYNKEEETQISLVLHQCEQLIQNEDPIAWEVKHFVVQKIHHALQNEISFSRTILRKIIVTSKECLGGPNIDTTVLATDSICKAFEFTSDSLEEELLLDLAGKAFECLDVSNVHQRKVISCLLHSMYSRNISFRHYLRILMGETMTQTVNQGIPEILDILTLVIQGFTIPVREEHVLFCRMYLTPLLSHQEFTKIHENLRRALYEITQRLPTMAREIVSASLLQLCCDPNQDPKILFDLAIDLLPRMTDEEFFTIQVLLYDRMSRLMKTVENAATAVRAFEDMTVCGMIVKNIGISRRFLLPALQTGILVQIDPTVTSRCCKALKIMQSA